MRIQISFKKLFSWLQDTEDEKSTKALKIKNNTSAVDLKMSDDKEDIKKKETQNRKHFKSNERNNSIMLWNTIRYR